MQLDAREEFALVVGAPVVHLEDLEGLARTVSESLDMKCIFEQETYQTDYWCEIMPAGTSKGAAARALKELNR